jgi:hypothetical protein
MDSKLLHDMFVLTIPVAEKILRPIVVYVFLIVGFAWQVSASWRN